MKRSARVTSIQALRRFKAALQEYQETLSDCTASMAYEAQRGISWIEGDRTSYWPVQIRDANDRCAEARNALSRKLLIHNDTGHSGYDEKKALQSAKERVRYCEQRFANSKHWSRIVSHHGEEFQGQLGGLNHFVDHDLPKAIAKLELLASALERYTSLGSPDSLRSNQKENS